MSFLKGPEASIDNTFYLVGGGSLEAGEERGWGEEWRVRTTGFMSLIVSANALQCWLEKDRMRDARHGHGVVAVSHRYFHPFCNLLNWQHTTKKFKYRFKVNFRVL